MLHKAFFYDSSDDSDGGSSDDDKDDSSDYSDDDGDGSDDSLEGVAPTPKRRKHAREEALKASLNSGRYLLDVLCKTFLEAYNPNQKLAADKSMVKYMQRMCERKVAYTKKAYQMGF